MKDLGYSSNDIKILYEMYKKTDIKIKTPFGEISSMEIQEVVKQGSTYGPIMCCMYNNIQSKWHQKKLK